MVLRNVRIMAWFNFFTDFKLYAPIAVIYFSQVSGSFALGMSIFSIAMIASAIFEIPTGVLSDLIGRKKTLLFGAFSAVCYAMLYAIGQSYWILVAGAVFEGLSRSFYSGNNNALLHDTLSHSGKADAFEEYLGKTSAMFQIALAISAITGGILASWSFPLIMWLSVVPQTLCLILGVFLIEPKVYTKQSGNIFKHLGLAYTQFIKNRKLRLLSISSILTFGFGEAGYQFQSAFYNTIWPVWAIGIAKALSNAGAAISFHFSGKLIKKFGAFKIFITENIYNRVIKIIAVVFPNVLSPLLISSTSLFYGVTQVARNSLMQKEFTQEQRATMGSLDSFAGSIFFAFSALILGLLADRTNPAIAFFSLNFIQLINLWIYWKLFKQDK